MALVGKRKAKKRNKIETSLRKELLSGTTNTKHKAPRKVVVHETVEEGGEGQSESEEDEVEEESISSEPGISKVVRFEWVREGDERVGGLVVIWKGETKETVESVPGVMIDAPEMALKLIWDQYAQDREVLGYIDKMARSKFKGRRVVPHWRSITHYAEKNEWGEKILAAYPKVRAFDDCPASTTMPITAMPLLPLVSPTTTTPTTTTAPGPCPAPSHLQTSDIDNDSTVAPCRFHDFTEEKWSKEFVTMGCLKDKECGG